MDLFVLGAKVFGSTTNILKMLTGKVFNEGTETEIRALDVVVRDANGDISSGGGSTSKNVSVNTLIDNATFNGNVIGEDIDFTTIRDGILSVVIGAISSTGTIQVKLQKKDSNNNYIDYLTLSTLSTGSTNTFEEFNNLPFKTGRMVAMYGGSGTISGVTVELEKTP